MIYLLKNKQLQSLRNFKSLKLIKKYDEKKFLKLILKDKIKSNKLTYACKKISFIDKISFFREIKSVKLKINIKNLINME